MGAYLGDWLRRERERLEAGAKDGSYSVSSLARHLDVQRAFVSAVERGKKALPRKRLFEWAEFLSLPEGTVAVHASVDRILGVFDDLGGVSAEEVRLVFNRVQQEVVRRDAVESLRFERDYFLEVIIDEGPHTRLDDIPPLEHQLLRALRKWVYKTDPAPDPSTVANLASRLEAQPELLDLVASTVLSCYGMSEQAIGMVADATGAFAAAIRARGGSLVFKHHGKGGGS